MGAEIDPQQVTGVILAGGKGSRMQPFSTRCPKPGLPICNKPLIEHHIEHMKGLGIKEIIVVIGHLGFEIAKLLGDGARFGLRIEYVEQKKTLGIANAVGKLEPHIRTPFFLLFLGDIFFISDGLSVLLQIMETDRVNSVLAVKEGCAPDDIKKNFAIILSKDNLAKRVIEKPRYVPNTIKGCGLYLFDAHIFDAIRRTPRTAIRDEYEITDSIQILIDDGYRVKTASVISWDMNLSYPSDLLKCNLEQLKHHRHRKVIGQNCQIHPGAEIENSVIGNNVIIRNPIKISNSLIFSNTTVDLQGSIESSIITPEDTIGCRV